MYTALTSTLKLLFLSHQFKILVVLKLCCQYCHSRSIPAVGNLQYVYRSPGQVMTQGTLHPCFNHSCSCIYRSFLGEGTIKLFCCWISKSKDYSLSTEFKRLMAYPKTQRHPISSCICSNPVRRVLNKTFNVSIFDYVMIFQVTNGSYRTKDMKINNTCCRWYYILMWRRSTKS